MQSFSKPAGFTGVRLGWTVVPEKLKFEDGTPVHAAWEREINTQFNGASNIAQAGGYAALDETGLKETATLKTDASLRKPWKETTLRQRVLKFILQAMLLMYGQSSLEKRAGMFLMQSSTSAT